MACTVKPVVGYGSVTRMATAGNWLAIGLIVFLGGCGKKGGESPSDAAPTAPAGASAAADADSASNPPATADAATGGMRDGAIDTTNTDVSVAEAAGLSTDQLASRDRSKSAPTPTADKPEATFLEVKSFHEFHKGTKNLKRRWQAKLFSDESRVNHGPFIQFFEDGKTPSEKGEYADGKRTGAWEVYRPGGQLAKKGGYAEDKVDGVWQKFRDDGTLDREESYQSGKKHGIWKIYAKDGKSLVRQLEYKSDKLDGLQHDFYENGQMRSETPYAENRRNGTQKFWYPSGKPQSEENYERGKKHGTFTSWTENGSIVDQKTFKNDILSTTP